jgi:histidinol-phosphatase (PHP family)
MSLSCIHTHSNFCDGKDDIETICRTAWEKGLSSIGFSSHAPIFKKTGFVSDWHIKEERFAGYLGCVREAKKRWAGKLPVYLGLEVDYIRGLSGPADRDYRELGLDYIIGSVHYVVPPRGAPFTVDGPAEEFEQGIRECFSGDSEALVQAYFDAEKEMISLGGFDILGHADLVKKNNSHDEWFSRDSKTYRNCIEEIASLCSGSEFAVEINTGGLNRKKTLETYPGLCFLRLLRAKNVPVIITSDAHRAADLDGHYAAAVETLLNASYTETVLFEGKAGGKAVWRSEKL